MKRLANSWRTAVIEAANTYLAATSSFACSGLCSLYSADLNVIKFWIHLENQPEDSIEKHNAFSIFDNVDL